MRIECYSETSANFCQPTQHVTSRHVPDSSDKTNAVSTKFLAISRNISQYLAISRNVSHIYALMLPASWIYSTPTHSIVLCLTLFTKTNSIKYQQKRLAVPSAALPFICSNTYSRVSKLHAICAMWTRTVMTRQPARRTVRPPRHKFCQYLTTLQHRLKRSTLRQLRNYSFVLAISFTADPGGRAV